MSEHEGMSIALGEDGSVLLEMEAADGTLQVEMSVEQAAQLAAYLDHVVVIARTSTGAEDTVQ